MVMDLSNTIGIVATNSILYIEEVFSALKSGKIVVPLRNREDKLRIEATNPKEIIVPEEKKGWFKLNFSVPKDQESLAKPAQISFTSGTEGKPKGVILSHRALNDVIERLQMTMNITPDIKEYIGIPVYHSFGYGRCRLISIVGGAGYIPQQGFNPKEISAMLANGSINSLSAVPSMLRILLSYKELFGDERLALRWIEIGSQPMSKEEKIILRNLFPNACIVQHYGLTEASRTSLLRIDNADISILASVGQAVGKTQIKIGETGRINIRGPHVASGLLIDGKIKPLPGNDGWFETNDLGTIKDGGLFFEGRGDNLINCGGQKIFCEYIEEQLADQLKIPKGFTICKIADSIYGEGILLCVEDSIEEHFDTLITTTKAIMIEAGINAINVLKTFRCECLPTTHTGKIQRKQLVKAYLNSHQTSNVHQNNLENGTPIEKELTLLFLDKFNNLPIQKTDSCNSLGGDSLRAIRLGFEIEKLLGELPQDWRNLNIFELASYGKYHQLIDTNLSKHQDKKEEIPLGSTNENPKDIGLWELIKEDFITHEKDFFSQGFWAVFNNRFGNWRMNFKLKIIRSPLTLIYLIHRKLIQMLCGIKLDYTVKLGRRVKLEHFGAMILGAKSIGDDVIIRQNTTIGIKNMSELQAKPIIEKGVNIGAGAVIVGDIVIGRYSVIGANVVVEKNVPAFSIVSVAPTIVITNQEKT